MILATRRNPSPSTTQAQVSAKHGGTAGSLRVVIGASPSPTARCQSPATAQHPVSLTAGYTEARGIQRRTLPASPEAGYRQAKVLPVSPTVGFRPTFSWPGQTTVTSMQKTTEPLPSVLSPVGAFRQVKVFSPPRRRDISPQSGGARSVSPMSGGARSVSPRSSGVVEVISLGCTGTSVTTQEPISQKLTTITPAADFDHGQAQHEDERSTFLHHVFSWLDWAPEPFSACFNALHANFPGALPGPAVHYRIIDILEGQHGFSVENTLLGSSICPDEINNEEGDLSELMKSYWGSMFPLGGISGAPFVGATGFGAFSHHVPDNGDIIIIFGPHVAISMEGEVGKYLRHGQHHCSTACGAVIGAYNACSSGKSKGTGKAVDETDWQMEWIKAQLEPYIDRIKAQANPMAAVAYQAYAMVKAKLEKIVNLDFGGGRLVLVGGIQINMPEPCSDHFLPLMFDVRQPGKPPQNLLSAFQFGCTQSEACADASQPECWGVCKRDVPTSAMKRGIFQKWTEVKGANLDHSTREAEDIRAAQQHAAFAWLTWSPEPGTPCYQTLHKAFPGALPGQGVHCRVKSILTDRYGFTPENTLFGNSLCPDEINFSPRGIARLSADYWGEVFPLGGLGGAPFAGKTGFKAFSHHVPDDGNILILYGPHVGISESGEVGKYLREGQHEMSTACGAVIGAYHACCGMQDDQDIEFDEADVQMGWIKSQILPHCNRLRCQESPLAALTYQAFESVKYQINKVVNTDFGNGRLVLLGGILINMPEPCEDHFLPISFEVRQAGQVTEVLEGDFGMPCPFPRHDDDVIGA